MYCPSEGVALKNVSSNTGTSWSFKWFPDYRNTQGRDVYYLKNSDVMTQEAHLLLSWL
jgi:hypothetical protein